MGMYEDFSSYELTHDRKNKNPGSNGGCFAIFIMVAAFLLLLFYIL